MMPGIKPIIKQSPVVEYTKCTYSVKFYGWIGNEDVNEARIRARSLSSYIKITNKYVPDDNFTGFIKNEHKTWVVMTQNEEGRPYNNNISSRYRMHTFITVSQTEAGQWIIEPKSKDGRYPHITKSTLKRLINNLLNDGTLTGCGPF